MRAQESESRGEEEKGIESVLYYNSGLGLHVLNHWCMSFMSLRLHTAWKIRPAARALRHSECHF